MSVRRILSRIQSYPAINPGAALSVGTTNGVVIDRKAALPAQPSDVVAYTAFTSAAGIYQSANIMFANGAAVGTPTTQSITLKLQHGDASDGSDMVDAPAAAYLETVPTLAANNANGNFDVDLSGLKRYIRIVATISFTGGTAPTQFLQSTVTFGDSNSDPAN